LKLKIVAVHSVARLDIEAYCFRLQEEAGADLADRFLDSVSAEFLKIAANPMLGPNIGSNKLALSKIRKWRVPGFPNMVIFYQPRTDGVTITRVIHAAQDWWGLLGIA
jgi:toxin ParE1/3/4